MKIKKLKKSYIPALDGEGLSDYIAEVVDRLNLLSELIIYLPIRKGSENYDRAIQLTKQLVE